MAGPDQEVEHWHQCFSHVSLFLCDKLYKAEVQLWIYEGAMHFHPPADSLRQELLDSLRAHVGTSHVRECEWRTSESGPGSGCKPMAPAAGEAR